MDPFSLARREVRTRLAISDLEEHQEPFALKPLLLRATGKLERGEPVGAVQLTEIRWQPLNEAQDSGDGGVQPASPTGSLGHPNDDEAVALMEDIALGSTETQKEAAPRIPPVNEQITPRALLAGLVVVFLLCIMTHRSNMSTGDSLSKDPEIKDLSGLLNDAHGKSVLMPALVLFARS